VRVAVEHEWLADHVRAPRESSLPDGVTEHRGRTRDAIVVVLREKEAPDLGPNAEGAEVVGGGGSALDARGIYAAAERDRRWIAKRANPVECLHAVTNRRELGVRHGAARVLLAIPEGHLDVQAAEIY